MFVSKQKYTSFSDPLNHFRSICRSAVNSCCGKMNKAFKNFIVETLLLFMLLPRKINFSQLASYGSFCEKTFRNNFSKPFDWMGFNLSIANQLFEDSSRRCIALDPSFITKSGKHTPGIGKFWSGCAGAVKRGLEILGLGLVDVNRRLCVSLKALQTPSPSSLESCSLTLTSWYLTAILNLRDRLIDYSRYIVADAYFSSFDFADGLEGAGFHLVSRFRSNAVLYYLYQGGPTGRKGRPRMYDGKIEPKNLDYSKMKKLDIYPEDGDFYHLVAFSKSLRRKVSLVIHVARNGGVKLFFSTDTRMDGGDVVDYYRSRFQIEFAFRDGKQFTGLCDCQARDMNKLDFAFNASLAAVNVAKLVSSQCEHPISIRSLKSLIYSSYLASRFFSVYGIRPIKSKNAQFFNELFNIAAPAA